MALADIVGHSRQLTLLRNAVRRGSLGPSFLFFGPRGVGKMTAALEFSRTILCLEEGEDACGTCESCRLAGRGAHPDLKVVVPDEKKKWLRIEQVRDAQEFLSLTPAFGKGKAVLVDPADAMTVESANAMLKTLEEPPPGSVILLVSSNLGGLPPTVISRCRKVSFGLLEEREVEEVLRRQGWPAGEAAAGALLAEGSPGSLLSLDGESRKKAWAVLGRFSEAAQSRDRRTLLGLVEGLTGKREEGILLVSLLLGKVRREIRARLGLAGEGTAAGEANLADMGEGDLLLLAAALVETSRLLDGNVNVKLALGSLFAGWAERVPAARGLSPQFPEEGREEGRKDRTKIDD